MADSHDNVEQVEKARKIFLEQKVEAIIHCGDFITPIVYDILSGINVPFYGVFGNNDYKEALTVHSHNQIKEQPYRFELGGRSVYICHDSRFVRAENNIKLMDLVVYGETHMPEIRKSGKTLVVNPGETCGWVTGVSSIALIDLATLSGEIVNIDD